MLRYLFILNLLLSVFALTYTEIWTYETIAAILDQGYQAETHHVFTSDGYRLEMHRIPYKKSENTSDIADRPVVFMMHGLTSSSDAFIILGSEHSIAYNLADAGFDVWMGNQRGNIHSRYHNTLDPDDEQQKYDFFDFSWEEIGTRDLPAMIDYILEYTGKDKLHYIGHSQGGTVFFVLNSMLSEYNDKIESAHILAGVGYMEYFPNEELIGLASMTDIIYSTALSMGIVELYPPSMTEEIAEETRLSDYCTGNLESRHMCTLFGVPQILGGRDTLVDSVMDMFEIQGSAGAALKQIAHYGQNIRDKSFRRWHYESSILNFFNYGAFSPPSYDLSLITINTTLHYTVNDNLLDERDVLNMAAVMPNTIVRKVARESFLHEDFVAAIDAKDLVTDYIIDAIRGSVENEQEEASEADDIIAEDVIIVDESQPIEETIVDNGSSALIIHALLIALSVIYSMCL